VLRAAFLKLKYFTMFTKGHPGDAIFCSILAATVSLLWFTAKNFEADAA
jgi:hypothetical protein